MSLHPAGGHVEAHAANAAYYFVPKTEIPIRRAEPEHVPKRTVSAPPAWDPPAGGAPSSQTEEEDEPAPSRYRMLRVDATDIPTLSATGAELTNLYKVRDPAELLVVMAFSAAYNAAIKANETLADADKPLAEKQMAVSMMARGDIFLRSGKGRHPA